MSKITVSSVTKVFSGRSGSVIALKDIDLEAREGEFVCVIGPSGCGKTTLLRICAGLEEPSTGVVRVTQSDPSRPTNTMVFQEQSVFPWLTVRNNVEYALRARHVAKSRRYEISTFYIDRLGLRGFETAYPHQLSGGMKQRVSLARAFANDPEIFFMDEPFANLDEQMRIILQELLLRIWDETRKTVMFVTHSLEEAVALGDRVVVMTARPGQIKAEVPINLPRPRSVVDLKGTPQLVRLVSKVWGLLREEIGIDRTYTEEQSVRE